ncbi:BREX-1 system adenine-specific DNA-methyltransferase PglX, partial [Escherichia coli]|nr:BREX-1 system adenine-specific DNA-methyltransferase PglX [Escherichia coli]
GGDYKKHFGNEIFLVDWSVNAIKFYEKNGGIYPSKFRDKAGICWSKITSGQASFRVKSEDVEYDSASPVIFNDKFNSDLYTLALLNTKVFNVLLKALNPTINTQVNDVMSLPFIKMEAAVQEKIETNEQLLINIAMHDWNSQEISFDFMVNSLVSESRASSEVASSYAIARKKWQDAFNKTKELEEENNHLVITSSNFNGINEELIDSEITLVSNPYYKYGDSTTNNETRLLSDSIADVLSYSIGCMMGRYSLDREGLVYAHEGNKGFAELAAEGAYKTFPADNDGILPLMDDEWFEDDVTSRVKEFVRTVWGEEHLQENLEFIAESLCLYAIKPKKGESALETIRRYLSTQFWKDHMKMYKKRPIYWLFSSGKEKAFECLVYLHRYNDATLSRMRTEYVVPLLARYQANIDRLNDQLDEASGGEATRLKRERDSLIKKFSELRSYDDRLRHYADMRISIDLDDGVKVNYGKFGDLLADVKAITGNAPEAI